MTDAESKLDEASEKSGHKIRNNNDSKSKENDNMQTHFVYIPSQVCLSNIKKRTTRFVYIETHFVDSITNFGLVTPKRYQV